MLTLFALTLGACVDGPDEAKDDDHRRDDADGDGFDAREAGGGDCDDDDAAVNPDAEETWYDGVDQNCDGASDYDADGDGFDSAGHGGEDCNEADADAHPDAVEVWYDGVDQDCDGASDYDADGDGFASAAHGGDDCDDTEPETNPDAQDSWYDGVDQDCDGASDYDADGDGYDSSSYGGEDCDDNASQIHSGAEEVWYDGTDQDCDGASDYDADADGHDSAGHGGDDCDETSPDVNPDAAESWYDGVDQDCDGASDYDADADGHDSAGHGGDDCDESSESVHPEAAETWYDGVDQDCDGASDFDQDIDGYDSDAFGGDDCDDSSAGANPGASETWYDGVDQNCDGASDYDADGDGYDGDAYGGSDCDDSDAGFNPGVVEAWDYEDTDCDGQGDVENLGDVAVRFSGEGAGDAAGRGLATGDVDGDGFDDIVVSSLYNDDGGTNAGAIHLVLGSASPTSGSLSSHIQFTGDTPEEPGHSVAIGDVDADGYSDVLMGAIYNSDAGSIAGAAYLLLGSAAPTSVPLSSAIQLTGVTAGDYAGYDVASAGDVDADGYGDLLVSAYNYDGGGTDAGAVFLSLGSSTPSSASLSGMVRFTGEAAGDQAGDSTNGAGDVDGDGYDDVLVGAWENDDNGTSAGAVYLLLGGPSPSSRGLAAADAQYVGEAAGDRAGVSCAGGIDFDADGYGDVVVGAYMNDDGGSGAGAAYVILGSASPSGRSLSTADAQFTGESAGDEAGVSVAGAGDVNADAHDDVVLGAFHHSDAGLYAGAAYVVLGSASPVSLGLSDAEAQVTGETAGGLAGLSVAGGGDVNDDGYDEVLVSAPYTSNGDAYLILGTGR